MLGVIVIDEKNPETVMIDVPVQGGFRVTDKEANKMEKYPDLAMEFARCGRRRSEIIEILLDY